MADQKHEAELKPEPALPAATEVEGRRAVAIVTTGPKVTPGEVVRDGPSFNPWPQ